ncbi:MAG: LexA family protein [Aristaeellaceae bacterium]
MIADRLKGLRKQNHMTQTALAERLNVTQTAISQWETDRTRPDQELLGKIASIFSVSVDYLLGENTDKNGDSSDYFRVPVFGSIPAGVPIEAIEDIEGYVEMQSVPGYNNREFFALRLSGNSMSPEYRNGDVVIFHAQETCESGQDCAVIVDNEDATFKRVRFSEKGLTLQPLNPDYEPIVFSNRDLDGDTVRVLGIGWEVRRKLIK